MLMAYSGGTFWLLDGDEILRTDRVTGAQAGAISMEHVGVVSPGTDVMWIAPAEGHPDRCDRSASATTASATNSR